MVPLVFMLFIDFPSEVKIIVPSSSVLKTLVL